MAPQTINYDNTHFYRICCKDLNIKDCYIGHTTDFIRRKSAHKQSCNNEQNKNYNSRIYCFIRDNSGWDNFNMILIDRLKCEDKLDAMRKEREYIEQFQANLNHAIPCRTKKEYAQDNKEQISKLKQAYRESHKQTMQEYSKAYKQANKDRIKEQNRKYYQTHQDKIILDREANKDKSKQYEKERYASNREKRIEQSKIYYEQHKDQINETDKARYNRNRDKINEARQEKIVCSCGVSISRGYTSEHKKSIKHQQFMQEI